jgi:hypothetical protein
MMDNQLAGHLPERLVRSPHTADRTIKHEGVTPGSPAERAGQGLVREPEGMAAVRLNGGRRQPPTRKPRSRAASSMIWSIRCQYIIRWRRPRI